MHTTMEGTATGPEFAGEETKVLVVDDESHVRTFVRMILGSLGITNVVQAADGSEAVAAYQEHRPSLVLMDVNMPQMSGQEATRQILEIDPDAAVMILSSENSMETVRYFQQVGAIGYLLKRSPKEEIAAALADVLNQLATPID